MIQSEQTDRPKDVFLDPRAIEEVIEASPPELALMIALVADTGLRPSELKRLRWDQVSTSFESLTIIEPSQLYKRTIPLAVHIGKALANRRQLAASPKSSNLVFPTIKGGEYSFAHLHIKLKANFDRLGCPARCERAGVGMSRFGWNDLRRYAVGRWRADGCSSKEVERRAGSVYLVKKISHV